MKSSWWFLHGNPTTDWRIRRRAPLIQRRRAPSSFHTAFCPMCVRVNFLHVRVFSCVRKFVVKVLFRAEYRSRSTINRYTIPLVNWSKVAAAVFARQTRLFVVSYSCFKISRSSFPFFLTACDQNTHNFRMTSKRMSNPSLIRIISYSIC